MKVNFPVSMKQILRHEGGYVDHPRDPGGATNLGITRATLADYRGRPVSKQEVRDLTVDEAIEIYRRKYAAAIRYNDLPSGLDHVTLDPAINSGPSRGVKWLQKALGVKADGKIGDGTLAKARGSNVPQVIQRACALRMGFLRGLKTWGDFGKGWSRRVAEVEAFSMKLAVDPSSLRSIATTESVKAKAKAHREKQTSVGTAGGATTGSAFGIDQIPSEIIVIVALVAVAVVVMLVGQARHNANRAEAYENLLKEPSNV